MVQPNWGLLQGGGGFQNALAQGMQFGQMARQRGEEKEFKNALAQFDPTNPETLKPIMAARPEVGLQLQGQVQQQQQARQQKQQTDMGTFRRLLKHAAQSPEGWMQALSGAQQLGLDVSGVPQQYDPEWAQQQLFIMDALETPEGKEALSTAGKQAVDMGFQPGTPEFQAKVTEIWQQNGAIPYTDASGATRLYIPGRQSGGPQPGSVVSGFRFKGGNPNDPNAWEPAQGGPASAPGNFPAGQ